jgi:hypothetical protein
LELGEAEHEDLRAGIFKEDLGFGIYAAALDVLHYAATETLVKDSCPPPDLPKSPSPDLPQRGGD